MYSTCHTTYLPTAHVTLHTIPQLMSHYTHLPAIHVTLHMVAKHSFPSFPPPPLLSFSQLKYQEVGRIAQMGERLLASEAHYAMEVIHTKNTDLQNKWEQFSEQVDGRASLLTLSVAFHQQQDEVWEPLPPSRAPPTSYLLLPSIVCSLLYHHAYMRND